MDIIYLILIIAFLIWVISGSIRMCRIEKIMAKFEENERKLYASDDYLENYEDSDPYYNDY